MTEEPAMSHPEQDRSHLAALAVDLILQAGNRTHAETLAEWDRLPHPAAVLIPRLAGFHFALLQEEVDPDTRKRVLIQIALAGLTLAPARQPETAESRWRGQSSI